MTEEIAGSLVDLPEDWFQRAQRALADLQFKTEKQRRELEKFDADMRATLAQEKAPGAPNKRRGFFTF